MPSTTPDLRIEIGAGASGSTASCCAVGAISATDPETGGGSEGKAGGCCVDVAISVDAILAPAGDFAGQNALNTAPLARSGAAGWRDRETMRGIGRIGLAPFPPRPITARSRTSRTLSSARACACVVSDRSASSTTGALPKGAKGGGLIGGISSAAASTGATIALAAGGNGGGLEPAGTFGGNGRRIAPKVGFAAGAIGTSSGTTPEASRTAIARSMCCNWRTVSPIPTRINPPTAAIVPGVTTSTPTVPSGRITPDATRINPAAVVAAPKTSKNSDITRFLTPVRYPEGPYTHFIWPWSKHGTRINSGRSQRHQTGARPSRSVGSRCPNRVVGPI